MFQHSVHRGATLWTSVDFGSFKYYLYMMISLISKFSVPVFLMISGVNLLGKQEKVDKQIKRFVKSFVILFIFEIIYYFENTYKYGDGNANIKQFFSNMYTSEANGFHLWYMYAYLAFLMMLPFMRAMIQKLQCKDYIYLFVLAVIFIELIPILEMWFGHGNYSLISYVIPSSIIKDIILYPILGYFIDNFKDIVTVKKGTCLILICILNLAVGLVTSVQTGFNPDYCVVLNSVTIFYVAKLITQKIKINKIVESIIVFIGDKVFGVYLIHIILMHQFWNMYDSLILYTKGPLITCLLWILILCCIGIFVVTIYRIVIRCLSN